MARKDIYLTDQLKRAMDQIAANWSWVAQRSFETAIAQITLLQSADKELADWEARYRGLPAGYKLVQSARRQIRKRLEEFGAPHSKGNRDDDEQRSRGHE